MSNHKRVILLCVAVILLIGSSSLHAQYGGRWYGTGEGTTTPPIPTPYPVIMHPWYEWLGDIIAGEFRGAWVDTLGNYGEFRGRVMFLTPTTAHCQGVWTWSSTTSMIRMGPFEIVFDYETELCEGRWSTYHNHDRGRIRGERLE